jgi:DNA-binding PadR family transcriptional regulator
MFELFVNIGRDSPMPVLAIREEIILSSLLILGGSSHGAPLRKKVIELSDKEIVYGTLYNLLEVLIRKGYVTSRMSGPLPVQGGRSKSIYSITRRGRRALQETMWMHERIRESLPCLAVKA